MYKRQSFKSTLKIAEDKLQEYLGCFTVISDEYNVEISDLALNETSNALILNLMNPVYKDEEIKVSYRGFEGKMCIRDRSTDVGMALQGLVSGVSVTSSAGDPGSVANIQIRGVTSISRCV